MIEDLLAVLHPEPDDAALLASCLKTGGEARAAWESWRASRESTTEALRADLAAKRKLLPLLERSVRRSELRVEPALLDYVRAATLREHVRTERFRSIAAGVLTAIHETGATAYASRSFALAGSVYDDWGLRHCHDLDLLVSGEEVGRAARALVEAGLQRADGEAVRRFSVPGHVSPAAVLRHGSGLDIVLHTRPFAVPFYDVTLDRLVQGGGCISVDGRVVRIPSPEALLVHVLGHATYSASVRNLRWVTDAWHLLQRYPGLNWSDVESRLHECRVALPAWALLRYLVAFGLPVPTAFMERLRAGLSTLPRTAREVALGGALSACGGDVAALWRSARSASSRAHLVKWLVAPSALYVRGAFPERRRLPVALAYLKRPVRFVRVRWRAGAPGDRHA